MDNFQAIGQLVIKAQDLLDSIKGGAIRVMQTQFDTLIASFTTRLDGSVNAGNNKINDFLQTAGGGQLPESKFQQLIKCSGKVFGQHYLMGASPHELVDPSNDKYKANQRNGILLWKIGAAYDEQKLLNGLGFVGRIVGTRPGSSIEEMGCDIRILRQWQSAYQYIDEQDNSIGLRVGTFDYAGETYQTLMCDYPYGGSVILDGFIALESNSLKDDNFGRYINDKDNTVLDEYSPIATAQYQ